jgi:transcription initiation factor IIE alpha subunit
MAEAPAPSNRAFICPVCPTAPTLTRACADGFGIEIFVCQGCGSTLSVPTSYSPGKPPSDKRGV